MRAIPVSPANGTEAVGDGVGAASPGASTAVDRATSVAAFEPAGVPFEESEGGVYVTSLR